MKINKGVRVKRMRTKNINDPTANITTSCYKDTKLINQIFENKFPKSQIKKLIELSRKRIPSLSSDKDESEEMMHKINVIKASSKGKSGLQNINHSVIQDDNLLNNIIKSKL